VPDWDRLIINATIISNANLYKQQKQVFVATMQTCRLEDD